MAREYKVLINVDDSKARQGVSAFDKYARGIFDKLNKTGFKPTAFVNGLEVSVKKMADLTAKQEQAIQKTQQAEAKALADMSKAEAAKVAALQKTAQEQAKAETATQAAIQKTAQVRAAADAQTAKLNAQRAADSEKTARAGIQAEEKIQTAIEKTKQTEAAAAAASNKAREQRITSANKLQASVVNAEAKIIAAKERTVQQHIKAEMQQQKLDAQRVASMMSVQNAARNMFNQLKMIAGVGGIAQMAKSALTEMKAMNAELITYQKVTGASSAQVERVRQSSYKSSIQYGQNPSDYLSSVAAFARAGYGEQAEQMANLATKTQLAGDMTAEAASKFLIAVDAGYKLAGSYEKLNSIINSADIIDNQYASTLQKVADGMTMVAPLAASMGSSIEETMAAIGTMSAVTQREGTEVARALRMIMIGIAKDTKTEVEDGITLTEENLKDLNSILQEFARDELAAAEASGKLLDPMRALEAIAKAFKEGRVTEQSLFGVLNKIGGARYTNSLMGLIKNWEMFEEMVHKMGTDLTVADRDVSTMMEGWEAKANQLATTWTRLVNDTISDKFITGIIDSTRAFLDFSGNLENFVMISGGAVKALSALSRGLTSLSAGQGFGSINAANLAFSILAVTIGAVNAAVDSLNKKTAAQATAAANQAKSAFDQAKRVHELTDAYEKLAADGTIDTTELGEAQSIQQELNNLVGDLPGLYDLVTGSIEGNRKALKQFTEEQRKSAITTATRARDEAAGVLKGAGTRVFSPLEYKASWSGGGAANDVLAPIFAGTGLRYDTGLIGGGLTYTGSNDSAGYSAAYDVLVNARNAMLDAFGENASSMPQYKQFDRLITAWKDVVEPYKQAQKALDDLLNEEWGEPTAAASSSAASGTSSAAESVNETADAVDRLTHALGQASSAKKKFDEEMSSGKGDALKDYASAYAKLLEENKAGRVNSSAAHAAYRMLMGEEAYGATGGSVQALNKAWTGVSGGQVMSRADAWDILGGTYKDKKGNIVEGGGLVMLMQKLGMNVRNAEGKYAIDLTNPAAVQEIVTKTGLTEAIIRAAANAFDQYDVKGSNTNAPQEQDPVEKNAAATDTNTESTNANTTAIENLTAAVEANTTAMGGGEKNHSTRPGFSQTNVGGDGVKTTGEAGAYSSETPGTSSYIKDRTGRKHTKPVAATPSSLDFPGLAESPTTRYMESKWEETPAEEEAGWSAETAAAVMARSTRSSRAHTKPVAATPSVQDYLTPEGKNNLVRAMTMLGPSLAANEADIKDVADLANSLGAFSGRAAEASAPAGKGFHPGDLLYGGNFVSVKEGLQSGEVTPEQASEYARQAAETATRQHFYGKPGLASSIIPGPAGGGQVLLPEGFGESVAAASDAISDAVVEETAEKTGGKLRGLFTPEMIDEMLNARKNVEDERAGWEAEAAKKFGYTEEEPLEIPAEVTPEVDERSADKTEEKLDEVTKPRTVKVAVDFWGTQFKEYTYGGGAVGGAYGGTTGKATAKASGDSNFRGGMALVNDGTGAELIVDRGRAFVAGGGKPALVNLNPGAKIFNAQQTRGILGRGVTSFAAGNASGSSLFAYAAMEGGISTANLSKYFDKADSDLDKLVKVDDKKSGSGKGSGKKGKKATADNEWGSLKTTVEYILNRMNKALQEQTNLIEKQISELEDLRKASEEQNKLIELQTNVQEARANLAEAESQRSVRYLGEDGQWHWEADRKTVKTARENMQEAQKSLQDYLNDLVISAQIKALEEEKERLTDEYKGYADLWSDILDAVATPQESIPGLVDTILKKGTGAQKNGATAVRDLLVKGIQGGSYSANYTEALGEIAKAARNNPSVPGVSDAVLASLIASSGTNVSTGAMQSALTALAGQGTLPYGKASTTAATHEDTYYMINGVQIGNDMADLPLSEVLSRLSVFTNSAV